MGASMSCRKRQPGILAYFKMTGLWQLAHQPSCCTVATRCFCATSSELTAKVSVTNDGRAPKQEIPSRL